MCFYFYLDFDLDCVLQLFIYLIYLFILCKYLNIFYK